MEPTASDVRAEDGSRVRLWTCTPETGSDEAVLFVHGATFGARAAFELPGIDGWLTATALNGRTATAVDIRGYGDSERPDTLDADPGPEPPVRARTAALDALAAYESLQKDHDRVHLVGYSWGSIICGTLVTEHPVEPASLTQFAPVYAPAPEFADDFGLGTPPEPARAATRGELRGRWDDQLPTESPARWRGGSEDDDPVFDAFWRTLFDSGQGDVRDGERVVVAPNGTLVDLSAAAEGVEPYPAGEIRVPTLVVRGSLDPTSTRSDALALYDALGSETTAYAELSGGTHFLAHESRKGALYDTVRAFQSRA
ncbi:alpha/beta hydrolase [Natronomonas sp. EA1]|uniref:alpha/beta hydrolase n=1 Tax=Natronomonas sp. EA1 TaxID=3421655 RepID=UPI003EBE5CFB